MKVFISQPMSGKSDGEIVAIREKIFQEYKAENPEAELLDAYREVMANMGMFYTFTHPPIGMLSKSVELLADADLVIFAPGWENARGCRIEEKIATYYDIPKRYVR